MAAILTLTKEFAEGGNMFESHWTTARFLAATAATLAGAALFIPAFASAQEAHGIIVYGETDLADGVAYGFAWNFPDRDTAHAKAVNACTSSGGRSCVELAWFRNGCGALAMDRHGNAEGRPGMTQEQAEARALRMCEAAGGAGCNIVGSMCTAPGGDPGTWSGTETSCRLKPTKRRSRCQMPFRTAVRAPVPEQ